MQTPFKLEIWLQSYDEFVNAQNNIKQKNLNTVLANISKSISDIQLIPLDHVTNVKLIAALLLEVYLRR